LQPHAAEDLAVVTTVVFAMRLVLAMLGALRMCRMLDVLQQRPMAVLEQSSMKAVGLELSDTVEPARQRRFPDLRHRRRRCRCR
jgi:hypothetical protein